MVAIEQDFGRKQSEGGAEHRFFSFAAEAQHEFFNHLTQQVIELCLDLMLDRREEPENLRPSV